MKRYYLYGNILAEVPMFSLTGLSSRSVDYHLVQDCLSGHQFIQIVDHLPHSLLTTIAETHLDGPSTRACKVLVTKSIEPIES